MILTNIDHWPQCIQAKIHMIAKTYRNLMKEIPAATDAEEALKTMESGYVSCQFGDVKIIVSELDKYKEANPLFKYLAQQGYEPKKYYDYPKEMRREYRYVRGTDHIYISLYLKENASCQYVQVGTKVVEEPIYEVQCDEV